LEPVINLLGPIGLALGDHALDIGAKTKQFADEHNV
jgi:hypothetical protein